LQDRHGIKLKNSVVVGDKASDEQLGKLHCREGIRIDQKGFSPALIARILSEFSS
jgi:histidinol phosphatase-like enzyme